MANTESCLNFTAANLTSMKFSDQIRVTSLAVFMGGPPTNTLKFSFIRVPSLVLIAQASSSRFLIRSRTNRDRRDWMPYPRRRLYSRRG